jgi:F0F1-type ATP synthase assembly protein I
VAAGVLVGAVCGTALALILDNVAFGVCVGVIIGVASANAFKELLRFADYTRDRDKDEAAHLSTPRYYLMKGVGRCRLPHLL